MKKRRMRDYSTDYTYVYTTGFFGDVVEPSNNISAWVDQEDV